MRATKIWVGLALAFALLFVAVAFSPVAQFSNFNGLVISGQGIGTATPAVIINSRGLPLSVRVNQTPVAEFSTSGMSVMNQSQFLRYQDVAAAPNIYAAASVVSQTTSITTSILGIETPRNAVVALASDTQRAAGDVVITGVNARGVSTTETLAMTAITTTETLTGDVPWVSISSFAIPSQSIAITLTVTGGQKFGLPVIPAASSDLYHLTVNETPQAAPTVDTTYGSFDPVSTPAADVDYNVWIKQ